MFKWLTNHVSRREIKLREARGQTGRTNPELDALNREQTSRLSDREIHDLIRERQAQGKPVGKLVAAARERNEANVGSND